jgi:hypothetical protein
MQCCDVCTTVSCCRLETVGPQTASLIGNPDSNISASRLADAEEEEEEGEEKKQGVVSPRHVNLRRPSTGEVSLEGMN